MDYKTLSGGKVTRYILGGSNPNDPVQAGALEACRELSIKDATARGANVVIKSRNGTFPVSALVVGDTVLVSEGQVLRVLGTGAMIPSNAVEVLFPFHIGSIKLTRKSKYANVGNKIMLLKQPVYWTKGGDIIMTLQDLQAVFHERDLQRGAGHTIQSAEVSYEPNASKLYSH